MKSNVLKQLRCCNSTLKARSWSNYCGFLSTLLRSIHHPIAGELLTHFEAGNYTQLVVVADRISSTVFQTAAEHRLCNQLASVIRKYPFPTDKVDFDPRGAATELFLKSERKCSRINKKFALYATLRSPHEASLSIARNWISYVLGDLSLTDVWDNSAFGPGASIGIHGNATNMARKFLAQRWSVSPSAFHYAFASLSADNYCWELLTKHPGSPYYSCDYELFKARYNEKVELVNHNKIAFVAKTAKIERTIAVEPLLNGFLQKGVDVIMRKRLNRVGIDLKDQTRNQRMARTGSLPTESDPYVTIDLSSASDSVATELCRYMLPPDWFDFMNSIRSKSYEMGGKLHPYHKFTTMGNGFCFPLETLIFASLCHVAYNEQHVTPDFSVYGDDIIVRASVAARVLSLLKTCGFTVNTRKTFISGPFRESCGADWFEGEDVRPLSLDYAFDSLQNVFKFCNLARSKGAWEGIFFESLEFLETLIPRGLRLYRPFSGNVDSALEVPLDVFMASPFSRWNKKLQTWSWVELVNSAWPDVPVKRFAGYDVALMRGAVTGVSSPCPFSERRKTSTNMRRISHSAGLSTFLPCP